LAAAAVLDEATRSEDQARGHPGVFLHRNRKPLMDAMGEDGNEGEPMPCQSGMCFV
jgi:hypothetical protein